MSTLQLSQVGAVWDAIPANPTTTGGTAGLRRGFQPSAVPIPPAQDERPAPAPATVQADDRCDALDRECESHDHDNGTVIHLGPTHSASDDGLPAHHLYQYGDHAPSMVLVSDQCPELNLPQVDALIAAVEQQLAHLRDARHHLAAALGEAPPTEPPETQQARPADGNTDGQVTA
jgi:hypothetical protein